jgi:hypothetical protein
LPPNRDIDFSIDLVPCYALVFNTPYRIGTLKLKELEMQLEEVLKKWYICPIVSPWGVSVLFVKNEYGTLRLCIDFKQLNKVTIKKKYPLPRIDDLFDQLKGGIIFSNINLIYGYHQVRIKEEYINKTTFRTRYKNYEFTTVPFGISNDPTIFMCMMNGVFREHLDKFIIVFLDDILIYSKSKYKHEKHLRMVLNFLRENKLHVKISKCIFYQKKIQYSEHIVLAYGIEVYPKNIESISRWLVLRNVT